MLEIVRRAVSSLFDEVLNANSRNEIRHNRQGAAILVSLRTTSSACARTEDHNMRRVIDPSFDVEPWQRFLFGFLRSFYHCTAPGFVGMEIHNTLLLSFTSLCSTYTSLPISLNFSDICAMPVSFSFSVAA